MVLWKGIWIILVAVLHTAFAFNHLGSEFHGIIERGFWGAVNSTESSLAAWFFLFGLCIFAVGLVVLALDRQGIYFPKAGAAALLVMTTLGAVIMPVSGFWLLFPPLIAMLTAKQRSH